MKPARTYRQIRSRDLTMKRRQLLQLGAGLLLGGMNGVRALARSADHVIVVGGGIVGAAICYQLARRGARVTLLEKLHPAAGATGKSFAWINANVSKQPRHYHALNRLGVHAFHDLQQEIGAELPVRWGGTLEWYANEERAAELRRLARQQQAWGYPIRFVDQAEFARHEPRATPGKTLVATFSEHEGSVDSAAATRVLLRHAQAAGATLLHPCEVRGIALKGARGITLQTTQGEFHADRVVLACGVDTPQLAALAQVRAPLKPSPGIVVRSTPQPPLVQGVLVAEDSHFHQQADGRVLMGDDYDPPATEPHQQLASQPADFPGPDFSELHGQRIRSQAARYLPALADVPLESVSLCWRPVPRDDLPIIGYAPRSQQLYVAVMHSGVTLGPLVGELAAMELLEGVEIDLLAPYRPARFAG
jgi:glycine/D-amino acid oxidase-like deaminating enzyme